MRAYVIRTLVAVCLFAGVDCAVAQDQPSTGKAYPDGHGGEVHFPMGDVSFADRVEGFAVGDPDGGKASAKPEVTLGIPDYADNGDGSYLTLGCRGELVLEFTDNALIDVAGPDLYVFEIGPDAEPTGLAISDDGEQWTRVGRISGGKAEVDIAPYTAADQSYRFVKLVDLKQACGGRTPGADIDAVGAIGSASKIALDSAVLFDTGEHRLKPRASEALDAALARIEDPGSSQVAVAGHTDNVGTDEDNLVLSRKRAQTVAGYLVAHSALTSNAVEIQAYGESRPVANNDTEQGRSRNRRVELTVRTAAKSSGRGGPLVEILGVWETRGHGILQFRSIEGEVRGSYTSDGGALLGTFTSPTVFEGYWVENNSNRTCDTKKDAREHWGPIRLEFDTPERNHFKGAWGYCGDPADNHSWRGERLL